MEQMIPLTIDGVHVEVPAGTTVLEAGAYRQGEHPHALLLKGYHETANCRLCVVDCGGRALQAACVLPVAPNMVVKTQHPGRAPGAPHQSGADSEQPRKEVPQLCAQPELRAAKAVPGSGRGKRRSLRRYPESV